MHACIHACMHLHTYGHMGAALFQDPLPHAFQPELLWPHFTTSLRFDCFWEGRVLATSLFYKAAIYNSYKEGVLSVRIEACLCCIQLPSTTHTRKPQPFVYNGHIQLRQERCSLCQNGSLSFVHSCHLQLKQGRHFLSE